MDLEKIPILKSLLDYYEEGIIPLHMPGHKKGNLYNKIGFEYIDTSLFTLDVTEVPGIDNLHCPESAILEAQKLAAEAFGAEHTFFLVNGTTGGIHSMILGVTEPGDEIIIPRNCHKSVTGAIILGRLKPIYIYPQTDNKLSIAMGITPESVEEALLKHPAAKAVVITNPTFHGICSDIQAIADIVHKYNKVLLIDEAHGAHFRFNSKLPISSLDSGADIVVQSTHKTLASMTQSSMLHVKSKEVDIDKLKFFLQLTQTTSPSHLLLASLDISRYIMQEYGEALLKQIIDYSNWARDEINCIKGLYCIGKDKIGKYGVNGIDDTRLTINIADLNVSGSIVEKQLRESFKIQVEMSDLFNIVAITTVGDDMSSYERLVYGLSQIANRIRMNSVVNSDMLIYSQSKEIITEQRLLPWEAVYKDKEYVALENAIGRISGEMIIPYPPGIPIVVPGEVVTLDVLNYIAECLDKGIKIIGTSDTSLEYLLVVK